MTDPVLMRRNKQYEVLGELYNHHIISYKTILEISDNIEASYKLKKRQKTADRMVLINNVPLAYQLLVTLF